MPIFDTFPGVTESGNGLTISTVTRPLSPQELATLEFLLTDDFEGVAELRDQVPFTQVDDTESDPNFVPFVIDRAKVPASPVQGPVPTSGQGYNADGLRISVMLVVHFGYLKMLEYWSVSDPPADGPIRPETLQLDEWGPPNEYGSQVLLNALPESESTQPDQ